MITPVCPTTQQELTWSVVNDAERAIDGSAALKPVLTGADLAPLRPDSVLVRADHQVAYPIWNGIPVLLAPEALAPSSAGIEVDVRDPRYEEAYSERTFYQQAASQEAASIEESRAFELLRPSLGAPASSKRTFPDPCMTWLDAAFESRAQHTALRFIGAVAGKRVLQLGGRGIAAVKFLLAGANEAWLASPMPGEALFALRLAERCGVAAKFSTVVSIAEELPFRSSSFDVVYSGGCLHHTVTDLAFVESARVLKRSGRFGAVDPWRAPLYKLGTSLLGKREPDVFCRPLDPRRVSSLEDSFEHAEVVHHGALTRYPLLALQKLGLEFGLRFNHWLTGLDDTIASRVPGLRRNGSSVAVLGANPTVDSAPTSGGYPDLTRTLP